MASETETPIKKDILKIIDKPERGPYNNARKDNLKALQAVVHLLPDEIFESAALLQYVEDYREDKPELFLKDKYCKFIKLPISFGNFFIWL